MKNMLVSYLTCRHKDFAELCTQYDKHMRSFVPDSYDSRPDSVCVCDLDGCPTRIHVTRADYYCGGYSPAVFHMMVYFPSDIDRHPSNE